MLLVGCSPKVPSQPIIEATVLLDPEFSVDEKALIIRALNEWQDQTYNVFVWSLKESQKDCPFIIYFDKRSVKEEIIQDKLKFYGDKLRGFSNKHSDPCQPGSINLISDNIDSQQQYYIVTLHEIGHQLNLKHSTHPMSVMNSETAELLTGLEKPDIQQFIYRNLKTN